MARNPTEKAARLPQHDVTWQCTARRAPTWITPDDKPPYRPYLVLIIDAHADRIRRSNIQDDRLTPEGVMEQLLRAMSRPLLGSGRAFRPTRIVLDDAELVKALTPRLADLSIRCSYAPSVPALTDALHSMEAHLTKHEPRRGLLTVPGVTLPLATELFEAAAELYRQAPWCWLDNLSSIEIHYPADGPARYVILLGFGGETFGLSLYASLDELRLQYADLGAEQTANRMTAVSLTFDEPMILGFEDLDAIEKYSWPVAGSQAYPNLMKITPPAVVSLPSAAEITLLAAVARVVDDFVTRHVRANQGTPRAAEATYALPNVHGGQQITLRFPVDLPEIRQFQAAGEMEDQLDEFIEEWYEDEKSYAFARKMGTFLFQFLDDLETTGLSEKTLGTHEENCWLIGRLTAEYGGYQTFSPDIFLGGPKYLEEFQRRVTSAKTALAAYQQTWRRLEKYVREMGSA
ncbi:MAG: hypothetical protein CVU38_04645 [Chloroflexi bacterium HGW-Chloroflexi-1]|nr:MAG: hypothetical protein CVU38_04645 [Chloroflexi bacterium HGW-Chloroflexi-1]